MENQALEIIDMLYTMIAEAWGVPLGNDKCIVERDKALGLLDDLKAVLPLELSEARRLVNAREEFVSSAKQEADTLRRTAEEEAGRLVDKQSVYLAAQQKAEETVRVAEEKSRDQCLMQQDWVSLIRLHGHSNITITMFMFEMVMVQEN